MYDVKILIIFYSSQFMTAKLVLLYMISEEPLGTSYLLPVEALTDKIRRQINRSGNHDEFSFEEWTKIIDSWEERRLISDQYIPQKYEVIVEYLVGADWK